MPDSFNDVFKNHSDSGRLSSPDLSSRVFDDRLADKLVQPGPSMHPEQGPPSTIQPRSNYYKFPDTSHDWWPTDTSGAHGKDWPMSKEDGRGGWGVHWDNSPPVVLDWPPRYNPPPTVPDGPVYRPDPIQPPRVDDGTARSSVNINADARSIFLTAGLTGAGMGTGTYLADVYTGSVDPAQRKGLTAFWRDNLSPSQALVPERTEALMTLESQLPGLRGAANAAQRTFDQQVCARVQLADQLLGQMPTGPLPQSELNWYNARLSVVRNDAQFKPEVIMANAGTDAQVKLRQKLFTQDEASQISNQATTYWRDSNLNANAAKAFDEKVAARDVADKALNQAERGSAISAPESFLKGAGQGLLVASATVAADTILDRALQNNPHLSNTAHWGLQGIGMPLLLVSSASPTAKVLGAVAMVGASHALDQYMGPPTGVFSAFARPSLPEIGLATAGALVPARDWRVRAGLAVTGWLAGKAWNYLDDRYEITGRTEPRLRDAASAAADLDMKGPSLDRFEFAISEMRKFSDKNDSASAVMLKDWQNANSTRTSVEQERGSAALMIGYGESYLARGSRLDRDHWDKAGNRILAGADYDLGGQASTYLRAGISNLQEASRIARANIGTQLSSGPISDCYVQQLDYEANRAQQTLEKVYGKHDIGEVFDKVRRQSSANYKDMTAFADNLSQYEKVLSNSDSRFKAKIDRDLAIINVAFGSLDTGEERAQHYRTARAYAEQAARLDPNALDMPELSALVNSAR